MSVPFVAIEGEPARSRLQQLDLRVEELREAVEVGYACAADCTDHDPLSLPGIMAWGKTLGHLRDLTCLRGWTADRDANYETTAHPTNSHRVAVTAANPDTGRPDATPRTRTPKGPATSRAVRRNAQLQIVGLVTPALPEDGDRELWMLLHYFDRDAGEIRIELSCPRTMEGPQITAWRERIIIEPVPAELDIPVDHDEDDEDDIDIDVSRKPT